LSATGFAALAMGSFLVENGTFTTNLGSAEQRWTEYPGYGCQQYFTV